ncbi:MAG: ISAzo13 family transposase [Aquabacterium sp.]|uniref:ISAzo13 family transposase n=1 Tax=Aquabacterium sp. TaxID=1872578 RepID=UPI00271CD518|nr:ISAzo13 family transposase [Aquabacterium sp.]MDO9006375.1 ISAzo13 family transposase [Aquabacterium sp.]
MQVKLQTLWPHLNERSRRMLAAAEAEQIGYGGVSLVSRACGLSRVTIIKGIRELSVPALPTERIRRTGGGRHSLVQQDPKLPALLESLVEPLTRGDPESPLRWTCKSTRTLAGELTDRRHAISHEKVAQLLRAMDYSLQGNRKTEEGEDHPDRDAQFQHINRQVRLALRRRQPVISVDTKKKELLGNFRNPGRQWRAQGASEHVAGHDFPDPSVPRAYPYGIYDLGQNTGFVSVGTDHDTATFAVASIRGWWRAEGRRLYPRTTRLLITADGGGSNGYRLRLWKWELQRLADQTGLEIAVCHFPPGTSKWNKVEHRLFSFISSNWRGEPLRDYETVVGLIACTTTAKGLRVTCRLDRRKYTLGRKITPQQMASINLKPEAFHGEWNYVIRPMQSR